MNLPTAKKARYRASLPERFDLSDKSPEEKLAWKVLLRIVWDVRRGPLRRRERAKAETLRWLASDGDFVYPFETFAESLGIDEGYFRRKLREFINNDHQRDL